MGIQDLSNSWDNVCECVVKFGKLASILLTVILFIFYAATPLISVDRDFSFA